ncbi:hypothetical protein AHFPHNDE_01184 [Pseudomonas sp. MM227]|uniref:hypothetical protein n=1 Tax=Pseudomonas sp. MM227 TaxID=3019968 RepID=UPI00221F3DCC|nr:hypothetical protein [Pseudomonas sp. MM227]CAI3787520.1 hypothetical protein AHFPHNDE_01184 [Pseudomonas sp. MM227]
MNFMTYDAKGMVLSLMQCPTIPQGVSGLELTDDQYAAVKKEPWMWVVDLTTKALIRMTSAQSAAAQPKVTAGERMALLNDDYQRAMAGLQSGWPDYEIKTWTIQAEEAKQWVAADVDTKPSTPFLTQLWTERQNLGWTEPFADLVSRVIANNDGYTTMVARYTAVRHVAERNIGLATDPATVTWSFS